MRARRAEGHWTNHRRNDLDEKAQLADTTDLESFSVIQEWLKKSGYPLLLAEVYLAETEAKKAQSEAQGLKKRLEKAMKDGI